MPWILLFLPLIAAAANQLYLKRNAFIASFGSRNEANPKPLDLPDRFSRTTRAMANDG